jgi:hypothetical protein
MRKISLALVVQVLPLRDAYSTEGFRISSMTARCHSDSVECETFMLHHMKLNIRDQQCSQFLECRDIIVINFICFTQAVNIYSPLDHAL